MKMATNVSHFAGFDCVAFKLATRLDSRSTHVRFRASRQALLTYPAVLKQKASIGGGRMRLMCRAAKESEADDGRTDPKAGKLEGKPPPLIFKARWINKSSPTNLEAVQLVKVVFKLKYTGKYGEGVRMVGGHETLGNWSLKDSIELNWGPGDVWVSDTLELPVDGIFVYKYVLCQEGDEKRPIQWQTGNNQVLALATSDAPLLEVHDNWKGDPSLAFTCNPDGTNAIQAEQRLLGRVRAADQKLVEAQHTIADLSDRLRRARYEAKALREEAKIGANARLALKSQLAAERARASQLEAQVNKWQEEEDRAQRRLQEAVTRCKDDAVTPPGAQNMFTGSSKGAQVNNGKPGGSAFATTVTVEVDDEVAADAELDLEPEPAPAEVAADPPPPPQAGFQPPKEQQSRVTTRANPPPRDPPQPVTPKASPPPPPTPPTPESKRAGPEQVLKDLLGSKPNPTRWWMKNKGR